MFVKYRRDSDTDTSSWHEGHSARIAQVWSTVDCLRTKDRWSDQENKHSWIVLTVLCVWRWSTLQVTLIDTTVYCVDVTPPRTMSLCGCVSAKRKYLVNNDVSRTLLHCFVRSVCVVGTGRRLAQLCVVGSSYLLHVQTPAMAQVGQPLHWLFDGRLFTTGWNLALSSADSKCLLHDSMRGTVN